MKFQVELKQDEFTRLRELAETERRDWRAQAAWLLARALKAAEAERTVSANATGQREATSG